MLTWCVFKILAKFRMPQQSVVTGFGRKRLFEMKLKDKLLIYYKLLIYNIGQGRMPPKKKPAALSAKQEEEELSEMVRKIPSKVIS